METKDYITPAGNLEAELLEIKNLDSNHDANDVVSISNECGGFFTVICC